MNQNKLKTVLSFFNHQDQYLEKDKDPIWNEFLTNYLSTNLLYPYQICLSLFDEKELIESYEKYQKNKNKEEFVNKWIQRIRESLQDEEPEMIDLLVQKWRELCEII